MPSRKRTENSFAEELPRLIADGGWSVRALALTAGISQPHLSRILSGERAANPKAETVLAVSRALELPDDYFPEVREDRVVKAIRADPALREEIYRQITRR